MSKKKEPAHLRKPKVIVIGATTALITLISKKEEPISRGADISPPSLDTPLGC